MSIPDDLNDALRDAREGSDDEDRAIEADVNRALEAMSDEEFAYWVGRLIRMLEEEGLRLH